jgi:hypothetical protein
MSSTFTDKNFHSIYEQDGYTDVEPETLNPVGIDDTLKVGKSSDVTIANKTVMNSGEDCVDLVRVHNSWFLHLTLWPFGRCGITVKGASTDIDFAALKFERHGRECDIEIGQFDNYWYPGRSPTVGVDAYGPGMVDGTPVRVRLWDAEVNECNFLFDSGVEIDRVPKWIWYPYFLFRYAQIRAENVYRKLRGRELIKTS